MLCVLPYLCHVYLHLLLYFIVITFPFRATGNYIAMHIMGKFMCALFHERNSYHYVNMDRCATVAAELCFTPRQALSLYEAQTVANGRPNEGDGADSCMETKVKCYKGADRVLSNPGGKKANSTQSASATVKYGFLWVALHAYTFNPHLLIFY